MCVCASILEAVTSFGPKDILHWQILNIPGGAYFEIWPQGGTSE